MGTKKVNPRAGTKVEDHLERELQDPEFASHYIMAAVEENDPSYLKIALGRVVKAHGPTKISSESGIGRETLYKMLDEGGNPGMEKVIQILDACGLKFNVVPKNLSQELAEIVGARPLPRQEVVSKLWAYIKKNGLQTDMEKISRSTTTDRKIKSLTQDTFRMTAGAKKSVTRHLSTRRKAKS